DRRAADPACAVFRAPAGRELLDGEPLSADSRAHRATRLASDVIERTGPGGEQDRRRRECPCGGWSPVASLPMMRDQRAGAARRTFVAGCGAAAMSVRYVERSAGAYRLVIGQLAEA